jgi:predicted alpha/beta superfamily hydrolase
MVSGQLLILAVSSLLAATAATATAGEIVASTAQPLAIGETFTIESKVLGETRRINVYLPPPYAASPDTRFPGLYMPDGGIAEDFLHVAGLVQVSVGNATMRPFVLVGIENTERRRDLTGPTENPDDRKIATHVGGSAVFRAFLRTELMPAIDARYRTTSERAIVGESLAGLFVVETLMLEPDLFDTYIAFDPSLWWNNQALIKTAADRLRTLGDSPKRLYLACGRDPELALPVQALARVLRHDAPAALDWQLQAMPAETHATIYHPAALLAFRQLFAPGAAEPKP